MSFRYTKAELDAAAHAATDRYMADTAAKLLEQQNAWLDQAAAAALAAGIPVGEMWLEHLTDRIETRLMRHVDGVPQVGESSCGEVVARVWMDGLELRYEGIKLGAGWTMPSGAA